MHFNLGLNHSSETFAHAYLSRFSVHLSKCEIECCMHSIAFLNLIEQIPASVAVKVIQPITTTTIVVVYTFYWRINDDKPHHLTQIQKKIQEIIDMYVVIGHTQLL